MTHAAQLVLCTVPDADTADRLARQLVERRLAACVNIIKGVTSVYRWEGRVETGSELLLLIKTGAGRYAALEQAIVALHPYELPEILTVPAEGGLAAYLAWIDDSTGGTA